MNELAPFESFLKELIGRTYIGCLLNLLMSY